MKPKNVIMWMLCTAIIVLLMSNSVLAQGLREVPASDILKQIENGEDLYFKNVRITGKLDLSEIKLETVTIAQSKWEKFMGFEKESKIVESEIKIDDSVFEDDVDFSNTLFRKTIDIRGTTFLGEVDFSEVDFIGFANFVFANFTGDADFWRANFTGDADFQSANFTGDAYFRSADFSGNANFRSANFTGDAYFLGADFSSFADFLGAGFNSLANFKLAHFYSSASFGDVDFCGDADFSNAAFNRAAFFQDAVFGGNATFDYTEFNKVSFTKTSFTNVYLNESEFNQMNVEWSSLKDALIFNGPVYIKLIKNFREREQFEDADAAYYQYRRLSQANKEWSYSKLMDVVAGASCGYGVKPERPLIWAFGLIMAFTLVYWLGKGIKRLKENDGDKNRVSRWAAFYNAFYFSVVTFTTVGYGDWYPEDRYRIVVMIEGVLGWLLLALFIVTLANVMIRP